MAYHIISRANSMPMWIPKKEDNFEERRPLTKRKSRGAQSALHPAPKATWRVQRNQVSKIGIDGSYRKMLPLFSNPPLIVRSTFIIQANILEGLRLNNADAIVMKSTGSDYHEMILLRLCTTCTVFRGCFFFKTFWFYFKKSMLLNNIKSKTFGIKYFTRISP